MKQHIQTGTTLLLIAVGIVLALLLVQKLAALLLLMLIAAVLTTGIDPLVGGVQRAFGRWWKMPRSIAILLVMLIGVLAILGAIAFLITTAIVQAINFAREVWPSLQGDLVRWTSALSARYDFIPPPEEIGARIQSQSGRIAGYLWTSTLAIFGFIGGLFSVVTVLILTFFFSNFKDGMTRTFAQFIPQHHQAYVLAIGHHAAQKMGGWLRGQLLLALIITLIVSAFMALIGYPQYAILVGIIGGIGELVPMVGPYVAFFPALIIALVQGADPWQIIALIIFFAVLSQVENYILSPKIMEQQVELSPISTILALLIGGSLLGLVGALLAIPLAAAGRVVMLEGVFPFIQRESPAQIEQEMATEGPLPTTAPPSDVTPPAGQQTKTSVRPAKRKK